MYREGYGTIFPDMWLDKTKTAVFPLAWWKRKPRFKRVGIKPISRSPKWNHIAGTSSFSQQDIALFKPISNDQTKRITKWIWAEYHREKIRFIPSIKPPIPRNTMYFLVGLVNCNEYRRIDSICIGKNVLNPITTGTFWDFVIIPRIIWLMTNNVLPIVTLSPQYLTRCQMSHWRHQICR